MEQRGLDFLMSNVGTQAPTIFVLVVATVLAFVYFGRATIASMLTFSAVATMLATEVCVSFMRSDLMAAKEAGAQEAEEIGRQMATLAFGGSVGHAAGLGLLVAAIFVRRRVLQ